MRRLSTNNIDKLKIPHMIRLLYGSLLKEGTDVLTAAHVTIDDSTKVAPETALVVEFQR